jgi:spermidine/putrescine transport system ATP-binding protein
MTALVEIRDVRQQFGATVALGGVSLEIAAGSYTVLLGPSGSGKTTLLSILGGFQHPTSGRVWINGADCTALPPAKRPTATVFQDYALFPHMSIANNVAFGLRMKGIDAETRRRRAAEMLDVVGLTNVLDRKPHQLSGGQRQRVALARALVVEPAVLLLDEPLGALDMKLRRQMQDELKAIQRRVGTAFVHVTHDQEEAMALAQMIVVMNEGRIEDMGPPARVYNRPATRFTANFMGESTIILGKASKTGIVTALGTVPNPGLAPGSAVNIALRPEHFHESEGSNSFACEVQDAVFQGSFKRIIATAGPDMRITAKLPATSIAATGKPLRLAIDTAKAIVLRD